MRSKKYASSVELKRRQISGCTRLGNPDLDHKTWNFGFLIEHKIWKQIWSLITPIENPFQEGVQFVWSVPISVFRFCVWLEIWRFRFYDLIPEFPIESTLKLVPYDLTRVYPVFQNGTKIAIWMSLFVIYTCVNALNVCCAGLFNTIFGILFYANLLHFLVS